MPHRYTIDELEILTDYDLLDMIVQDREETTTNVYTPFCQRLKKLRTKLQNKEELTK